MLPVELDACNPPYLVHRGSYCIRSTSIVELTRKKPSLNALCPAREVLPVHTVGDTLSECSGRTSEAVQPPMFFRAIPCDGSEAGIGLLRAVTARPTLRSGVYQLSSGSARNSFAVCKRWEHFDAAAALSGAYFHAMPFGSQSRLPEATCGKQPWTVKMHHISRDLGSPPGSLSERDGDRLRPR